MKSKLFNTIKLCFIITVFFASSLARAQVLLAHKAPEISKETPAPPQSKSIAKDPLILMNQQADDFSAKRNGFNTFYIAPSYAIEKGELSLSLQGGIGEIQDGGFFPKGIVEAEGLFSAYFSDEYSHILISASLEFNFIPNNGLNTMIAGVDIPFSLLVPDFLAISSMGFEIGVGVFLKAFISKHFALIPRLGLSYELSSAMAQFMPWFTVRENDFNIHLSLGFRRYF